MEDPGRFLARIPVGGGVRVMEDSGRFLLRIIPRGVRVKGIILAILI